MSDGPNLTRADQLPQVVWAARRSAGRVTMHVVRTGSLGWTTRCGRELVTKELRMVDAGTVDVAQRCMSPGCAKAWPAQAQIGGGYEEAA